MLTFRLIPNSQHSEILSILGKYDLLNSSKSGLVRDLEPYSLVELMDLEAIVVDNGDLNKLLDYWGTTQGRGSLRVVLDIIFLVAVYEPYIQAFFPLYILSLKITNRDRGLGKISTTTVLIKVLFFFARRLVFFITSYPTRAI